MYKIYVANLKMKFAFCAEARITSQEKQIGSLENGRRKENPQQVY